MKRLLTIFTAVAIAASMTSMAVAQDAGPKKGKGGEHGPGPKPGGRMRMMTQEFMTKLNLTPEQKKKIEALQKLHMEKMKGLRDAPEATRREKMKAISDWHRAELKKILTAEQYAKLEKMMKEARDKFKDGDRPGARKPGGKPGKPGAGPPSGKP